MRRFNGLKDKTASINHQPSAAAEPGIRRENLEPPDTGLEQQQVPAADRTERVSSIESVRRWEDLEEPGFSGSFRNIRLSQLHPTNK